MRFLRVLDYYGRALNAVTIGGILLAGVLTFASALWAFLKLLPLGWSIGLSLGAVIALALSVDRIVVAVLVARGYKSPAALKMEAHEKAVAEALERAQENHLTPELLPTSALSPVTRGEQRELQLLRTLVGETHEEVMSHGASLAGDDLSRVAGRFAKLQLAAGRFAHHAGLQSALRRFLAQARIMLDNRQKTHLPESADEVRHERSESESAYRDLVSSCPATTCFRRWLPPDRAVSGAC